MIRAGHWYRKALPGITSGLMKAKLKKRLSEIAILEETSVMPGIDPNALTLSKARKLISSLNKLSEEQWSRLKGKEFKVLSTTTTVPKTGMEIPAGQRYLLVPCPTDTWNSATGRWKNTNFLGHFKERMRTPGKKPFMQLCFSLDGNQIHSVAENFLVTGPGQLRFCPSDAEGGGRTFNNTGFVRVKVIKIVR